MAEELKPCPFCEAPPIIRDCEADGCDRWLSCTCCGFVEQEDETSWNTRPIEDALQAEISYLQSIVNDVSEDNAKLRAEIAALKDTNLEFQCLAATEELCTDKILRESDKLRERVAELESVALDVLDMLGGAYENAENMPLYRKAFDAIENWKDEK